jgi:hypothetical protein
MSLMRGSFPPLPFPMTKLSSQQPATADIALRLGSNTNMQAGHVDGGQQLASEQNPAPRNPSGDYGHDHSGGQFGKPLFRSVAVLPLVPNYDASNFLPGPAAVRHEHGNAGASIATRVGGTPLQVWCPPCDPQRDVGAYAVLSVSARIEVETTALISGDTLKLVVIQATPGGPITEVEVPVADGSLTSTGYLRMTSDIRDVAVPMAVGRMNTLSISTKLTRTGSGSSRGATFRIDAVELGVYS